MKEKKELNTSALCFYFILPPSSLLFSAVLTRWHTALNFHNQSLKDI
jgi:hypothetical protein